MRIRIFTAFTLLMACTARPVELDDEAEATTTTDESSSGTTGESGDTTETEDSTSDDSLSFVPEFDVPGHHCDSFAQDCPPGEKCVPYSSDGSSTWNANKCVPVLGDQQPGEACTWAGIVAATDDCDATSLCWDVMDVDGELIGRCAAFCQGSADRPECPPPFQCIINGDSTINLCISTCDPLVQDCAAGLGCFWTNADFQCILTDGELPTGEPCGSINDCAPGNLCVDTAALPSCVSWACCTAYCDLTVGDAGCVAQPGTVCTAFFDEGFAPPGHEDVGVCVLPP